MVMAERLVMYRTKLLPSFSASSVLIIMFLLRETLSITVTEVLLVSPYPYVLQGEPAVLTCRYIVEPPEVVTEVEWEKDGVLVYLWMLDNPPEAKDVLEGNVDLTVTSPSSLSIEKVHMNMQGTYTCRVRTNGKTAQNEMFLMVIVASRGLQHFPANSDLLKSYLLSHTYRNRDVCRDSAWKTNTDMVNCIETVNMHCIGIFPKPSPACGVYSEKTGKYLNSVPFDSVNKLFNGTYEVSFNRRFIIQDYINHTDISFRCYMMYLGTPWRSGLQHKMFGEAGCEENPPRIVNGYYNLTEERSCWGFPSEGSQAEYHCEEGYRLLGSALYTCSDGKWSTEGVLVDGDYQVPICSDINRSYLNTLDSSLRIAYIQFIFIWALFQ